MQSVCHTKTLSRREFFAEIMRFHASTNYFSAHRKGTAGRSRLVQMAVEQTAAQYRFCASEENDASQQ
jgi:hypothetical protein